MYALFARRSALGEPSPTLTVVLHPIDNIKQASEQDGAAGR